MNLGTGPVWCGVLLAVGLQATAQTGPQTVLKNPSPLNHSAPLGSVERGKAMLAQRQETGCVLCHQIPGLPIGGELGPSLHGLAQRSTLDQARERIADARRFNPQTIMPAYLSTEGLHNVAAPYRGQTVLTPQAVEDILSVLFQVGANP